MTQPILILDGYNLLHRARSGFTSGSHAVAFNFLRSLRALIAQFSPSRVYMTLEGHPKARHDLYPEYKANRKVEPNSKKHHENVKFHAQKDRIIELVKNSLPINVVRHPNYEGDDVVYNLIKRSSTTAEFVVISSDTDFTQLLNGFDNVKVYNPITKKFVEWDKSISYVVFKALKGDASDNIKGIAGINEERAMKLAQKSGDPEFFALFQDATVGQKININLSLVRFATFTDEDMTLFESSTPVWKPEGLRATFEEWQFTSLLKDKTWQSFVDTFQTLVPEGAK